MVQQRRDGDGRGPRGDPAQVAGLGGDQTALVAQQRHVRRRPDLEHHLAAVVQGHPPDGGESATVERSAAGDPGDGPIDAATYRRTWSGSRRRWVGLAARPGTARLPGDGSISRPRLSARAAVRCPAGAPSSAGGQGASGGGTSRSATAPPRARRPRRRGRLPLANRFALAVARAQAAWSTPTRRPRAGPPRGSGRAAAGGRPGPPGAGPGPPSSPGSTTLLQPSFDAERVAKDVRDAAGARRRRHRLTFACPTGPGDAARPNRCRAGPGARRRRSGRPPPRPRDAAEPWVHIRSPRPDGWWSDDGSRQPHRHERIAAALAHTAACPGTTAPSSHPLPVRRPPRHQPAGPGPSWPGPADLSLPSLARTCAADVLRGRPGRQRPCAPSNCVARAGRSRPSSSATTYGSRSGDSAGH